MSAYCGLPVMCRLSVGSRTLDLMDPGQGFRLSSLDLSYPSVREDATDAPQQSGQIDTTQWFSARAVTISGSIIASASGSRSASLQLLAPYLDPAARPVLTYQTEADTSPRQLVLRAYQLSAPLDNPAATTWSAQWKAPLGVSLGTVQQTATVGPSTLITAGRTYPLTFNRIYPASSLSTSTVVVPNGDYPTPPVFTVRGPITAASITVHDLDTGASSAINLQATYTVPAGRSITIDCGARTITDDQGNNVYGLALAAFAIWPVLYPGDRNSIAMGGSTVAGSTQLGISWYERWLI